MREGSSPQSWWTSNANSPRPMTGGLVPALSAAPIMVIPGAASVAFRSSFRRVVLLLLICRTPFHSQGRGVQDLGPGSHHLVFAPIPPANHLGRIGISRIIRTVVVVEGDDELAASFDSHWILK